MKIADMFGAGLPVCALDDGGCLREMVRPGDDARLFRSADDLAALVDELLGAFPIATPGLDRLRAGALSAAAGPRWEDEWRACRRAAPAGGCVTAPTPGRPLRVAFVHPELGLGGAERLMVDAALSLQARGHHVTMHVAEHDPVRSFAATRDGRLSVQVCRRGLPLQLFGRVRLPLAVARDVRAASTALDSGERWTR